MRAIGEKPKRNRRKKARRGNQAAEDTRSSLKRIGVNAASWERTCFEEMARKGT